MTGTGACKWCGQERLVEVDHEDPTQEELDRAATWECGCKIARAEKEKAERLQMIKDYLDEEFGENDGAHEAMAAAVVAVMRKNIKKAQIEAGVKTYTVKINSAWMIEISWTRTEKECMEY